MTQADLFGAPPDNLPPGLRYDPAVVAPKDAQKLAPLIAALPFEAFEFHGFTGKRRVVSFGWKYDFSERKLREKEPIPPFLLPLREQAAAFGGVEANRLEHALVTEYAPGAAIGWHRDKAVFEEVIGISLGAACTMRFRRPSGSGWQRRNLALEPGSAYLISGAARTEWEHSIPPVEALRYSVTFRTLRA
ncbi:MAG TPA: alpha-ketoglutarate-dependent dioxygenase AlkB [Devosia sp.]|jgi:alkylated DNA repair dioxygenase AlkB|nr:alpha-ketoglutarate-dependent dioxygenase AlkB [Devosia sp.]